MAWLGIGVGITDLPVLQHTGGTPTPTPAPSFSVQPSITGTPQVGVSYVGTPGTASNTSYHTYRWLLSTTSGGTYTAISGATSASYTPVSGDETKYLKFEDTATGLGGSTVATTTFAGPVSAAAVSPTLATLGLSSTTFTTGASSSGTITGATTGSSIAGTTLFSGFTINGPARTWAWDGTGSVSTPTVTLTETLAGATNTPHASNISCAVIAPAAITAPVISQTSAAGANPFLWTTAENATFYPGYYWNVQTATGASTSAASTNLLAGTTTANVIQQIEPGDLAGNTITFTGLTTTSIDGPFALYERVGQEDGAGGYTWGPFSNVLTDTLATPTTPTALVSTTGVGKSQYLTVNGTGNLVATGQTGFNGAPISARATNAKSGKRQFQATSTRASIYNMSIGIDDGTTNLNSGFPRPGQSNSAGITFLWDGFDWNIYVGGVSVQSGTQTPANGDIMTCTFDSVAGTASFYRTRSGTTIQFGVAQAVTLSAWYPIVGFESNDAQTLLFATGQARTLDSGYSTYD